MTDGLSNFNYDPATLGVYDDKTDITIAERLRFALSNGVPPTLISAEELCKSWKAAATAIGRSVGMATHNFAGTAVYIADVAQVICAVAPLIAAVFGDIGHNSSEINRRIDEIRLATIALAHKKFDMTGLEDFETTGNYPLLAKEKFVPIIMAASKVNATEHQKEAVQKILIAAIQAYMESPNRSNSQKAAQTHFRAG